MSTATKNRTTTDNHAVAQAVHDLGSALWFGGAVMGVAGVNKSGRDLSQGIDRIRVANSAWSRFGPVEWAGVASTLLAGIRLTQVSERRLELQPGFALAGVAKAVVATVGAGATAYAAYSGAKIGKLAEAAVARGETVDVKDATVPTETTPPEIANWQRRQRIAQVAVPALAGANIVLDSYLVQSYRPAETARGIKDRLLSRR